MKVEFAVTAEGPPPGPGLVTTTGNIPPVARSAAGILTVMTVPVLVTGTRAAGSEPKLTVAPVAKFVPLIVSRRIPLPALALAGTKDVTVGTGLFTLKAALVALVRPAAVAVSV